MQKFMNNVTQSITLVGPHLLPPAAVIFSVLGLLDKGLQWGQVAALTFVLVIFSGLLSEALGKIIQLKNTARSYVIAVLAVGLTVLEIVLVHEGMAWAFNGLIDGWMLWAVSVFFTMLNVFAKYGFIDKQVEKTSLVYLKETNNIFSKAA